MANLMNYQESNAAMLMLETQQRAIGTKTTTATANGDTSAGVPPSPLIKIGGARFHQHLPPPYHHAIQPKEQHQQQQHYQVQHFLEENIQETPVRKIPSSCINVVHENAAASHALAASTTATATLAAAASASSDGVDDIRKYGYLRKQKHGHKRFFVLRGPSHLGPSRLEYYDSEKKFRNSLRSAVTAATITSPPKRVIYLYQCFTVNKRADSKNKYLIALYTKDEYFAIVAENEQEQDDWYLAVSDLMNEGKKSHMDAEEVDDGYGTVTPGTVFKEVWQVNVKPKGLGQTKNLTGVYRLCLSTKTIHLVKLNSETPCVNVQLMNIRRCGHSESFFFIEVGRSSSIGPGEIWMQVDDSVVAQNMHETILETMKALKAFAEFRPRSKSQSSGSNPMAFITTRRHLGNLPPSQTGLQRRSRTESVVGTPPASKSSGVSGYRFRTSSEGEGTMNRPFRSVTGSLVHLSAARINLGRQEGGGRYVRALAGSTYHTRSASLPVSHFPSTTSPVSVSSSSGHGSASDTLTRPSSASICGSPSDGGFNSSDEYGSSPGDFRYFRVRSNTPDSLGNTPPIREENCLGDYMAMGRHHEMMGGGGTLQDESADEEKAIRKRTHSFSRPTGGSNGVTMYQKMTQTTSSLDESVAEASPLESNGHMTCQAKPPSPCADQHRNPSKDEGYMPMMPGVVPSRDGDYMPMQPSAQPSASQPGQAAATQQVDSQGYMMMLPGGVSSPLQASPRHSGDHRQNGEYMDMSQSSAAVPRKPSHEGYYLQATPETPKSYSPYFSLPRSYKAPLRENHECDEYVPMSSPVKPVYTSAECSSRSSVGNPPNHPGLPDGCSDLYHSDRLAVRPTRLSLGRHNFHSSPTVSEAAEPPSSPGEYINIEFGDRHVYTPCSLSAEGSPSSLGSSSEHRRSPLHEDYISLDMDKGHLLKGPSPRPSLVAPWNPPSYIRPLVSSSSLGGRADGYTEMTFGLRAEAKSPTAMLQHLCVMEQCYPCQPPPSPPAEPRVIRADPQGRRRHSSETFSSSPPGNGNPMSPTSPHLVDGAKWQSSTSFDSIWLHLDGTASPDTAAMPVPTDVGCSPPEQTSRNGSAGYHNGLNYIALDLREDPRAALYAPPAVAPSPPSPLPHPENGAYASIDFAKSEGLTSASQD